MKEALDTCRILVDKMERVNEVDCCYAKEGKVFALTILLLLGREKVIDPTISEVKDDVPFKRSMTFRQFVNHELAKSIDFECRGKGSKGRCCQRCMMLLQESGFSMQYKDIEISNIHHSSMVKALDEWHYRMQKLHRDAGKTISNGSLDGAAVGSPYVQHGIYLNAYTEKDMEHGFSWSGHPVGKVLWKRPLPSIP